MSWLIPGNTHHPPKHSVMARMLLAWILLLLMPAVGIHAEQHRWEKTSINITYDSSGSPLDRKAMASALNYVAGSWAGRTGLTFNIMHLSHASSPPGDIHVSWKSPMEIFQATNHMLGFAATRKRVFLDSGEIASAEIWLNRALWHNPGACFSHTLMHELGHALGIPHVAARDAVMFFGLSHCHHSLGIEDITASPYDHQACHAEFLPADEAIHIPAIKAGNRYFSGRLLYRGGAWQLDHESFREILPQPDCLDSQVQDGDLILRQVWSMEGSWNLLLEALDAWSWRLDTGREALAPSTPVLKRRINPD